ncbi:MAG: 23S rRNA (adenine(2503)-C(2))-methyltransferase RlmN [Saprospiraceae bacterium]|nr:23S rRNA (adenine(2503)-C(2))-methyltransferase RlmN [Saprospiraceae bacterium]
METQRDIRLLNFPELEQQLLEAGEQKFRAKQIWQWIWQKGARSFEEMTNLSVELRQFLSLHFEIKPIKSEKIQLSTDGTIKTRFQLHDGHFIESVLIPVPNDERFTVCVSCQVGCSLTCKFCATGKMKRIRNLDPGEIVDQVVEVNKQCLEHFNHPLTNIVYMGMGEPLLTYQNVMKSIERITSPDGLGMSPKRITVSTAGIAKMIHKLAEDQVKFNLALSLHAANDVKRNEIMPINEQNSLQVLMDSLDAFYQQTGNRITFEYIALNGFNDTMEDAAQLLKLCRRFPVKLNIIEYNPIEGEVFSKSDDPVINRFAAFLAEKGVAVTLRRSRGKDIDAACGQLANKA